MPIASTRGEFRNDSLSPGAKEDWMKTVALLLILVFPWPCFAKERVADGKFWTLTAARAALMVADIEGTQRCLDLGVCLEGNPLMPSSRAKVYAVQVPITVGMTYFAYRLKKSKCPVWWLAQTALIGAHGIGFTVSFRF